MIVTRMKAMVSIPCVLDTSGKHVSLRSDRQSNKNIGSIDICNLILQTEFYSVNSILVLQSDIESNN